MDLTRPSLKSATPLVDGRSWTALKMGNVVVAGDVNLGLDGVTAEISVDALDLNLASESLNPAATVARLDWTRAFDLDVGTASLMICSIRARSSRRRWIWRSTLPMS